MDIMMQPTNTSKYANVLRPLTAKERAALKESLSRNGLLQALIIDQHGNLLDGFQRLALCAELGIQPRFQQITTNDPIKWIKGHQMARRNLNREEMAQLIAEQFAAAPTSTNKAIADIVGVKHDTVGVVRAKLVASGKLDPNIIRREADGRPARGRRPGPSKSNCQLGNKNSAAPAKQPVPEPVVVPAVEESKPKKYDPPSPIEITTRGLSNLADNIVYHFADNNGYHRLPDMVSVLDPTGALRINEKQVKDSIAHLSRGKSARVETRKAAKGAKHYRIYRQEKVIGLSVLKAKFRPVIEELKEMAEFPISHQTTGRFQRAAGLLTQLLRDLEAE